MKINVQVMNYKTAEEYALSLHDEVSVMISISSRDCGEACITPNQLNNIQEVKFISFNDTDNKDLDFGGITNNQAKEIADFVKRVVKEYKYLDTIIVHCEAGQSRSAGLAAAILKWLYNDDTKIFNNMRYTPNMMVYRAVLNKLME